MSVWIDKDGRRHVGIMLGGKRVHRVLPQGASARDAKQLEADLRAALGNLRAPTVPGDPPLAAVMGLYVEHAKGLRSPKTAIQHAERIGPWAAKYRASQSQECAAHVLRDMKPHYKPATINRTLGALKKGLALAWERRIIPENHGLRIKRLPEHNARDITLTIEQVKALAGRASEQVAAAIWIALYTGLRRGEILALRREDIGADRITVRAGNTKTLKTRVVPIAGPLRKHLAKVPLKINREGLKSGFRHARERAGMPWVTFHDLRRSCGTLMIQAGVDLYVVSKVLGHSSTTVTQARYAHLQIDRMAEGLGRTFGKTTRGITPKGRSSARKAA